MAADAFVDDPTIGNDSELWRRIHPDWVVQDHNAGVARVSSAAFAYSRDGSPTSVLLADIVRETGRDAAQVMEKYPGYALASITAGKARACEQRVARDPLPDEPAHAYLFGKRTKSIQRRLAGATNWVIPPDSTKQTEE